MNKMKTLSNAIIGAHINFLAQHVAPIMSLPEMIAKVENVPLAD